jgi:hypothetical protein
MILARDIVTHSVKTRKATNCRVPVISVEFIERRKSWWIIGRSMMVALKLAVITAQAVIMPTKMIENAEQINHLRAYGAWRSKAAPVITALAKIGDSLSECGTERCRLHSVSYCANSHGDRWSYTTIS